LVKAALPDQVGGAELADREEELAFPVPLRDLLLEPLFGHLAADRPSEPDQIADRPVVEGDDRLVEIVALDRAGPDALAADDRIGVGRRHGPDSTNHRVVSRAS